MTSPSRRNARTAAITTAIGLVGVFVVWLVTSGWSSVVKRPEFELHVQHEGFMHVRAAIADSIQRELSLEVLCEVKPTSRKCGLSP